MKKRENRENGITLIALVITIIVLIILAGVSINLVLGKNGIIRKSQEAQESYAKAKVKESIELAISELQIHAMEKEKELTLENLTEENGEYNLDKKIEGMEWEDRENASGNLDGYHFSINDHLEVIVGNKITDLYVRVSNINGMKVGDVYTSRVEVTLKATFDEGQLLAVYYSLDNGEHYQEGSLIELEAGAYEGENKIKYKAKGKTKEGEEVETEEKWITIKIDTKPPVISKVEITNVKDFTVDISVTAQDDSSPIKEYEYYTKAKNEEDYTLNQKTNEAKVTLENLEPLTEYSLMVVAIDEVENRSQEYKKEPAFTTTDNLETWQRLLVLAGIDYTPYQDFSSSLTTENTTAIANSTAALNYIGNLFKNANHFRLIANHTTLIKAVCENSNARLALYNNYTVTQSILASSTVAINAMKSSSRYQVVSGSSTESFIQGSIKTKLLYNGKAFVLSISQSSWNDTRTQYQTIHGHYIDGTRHGNFGVGYTNAQINSTYGNNGLRKTVYKFASVVRMHPNWYINGSTTETGVNCFAAIFKI